MKKLTALIMALAVFTCALFAQESDSVSSTNEWYDHVRVETDFRLGLVTSSVDMRGAYMFPLNSVIAFDAGLDLLFNDSSLLTGFVSAVSESYGGSSVSYKSTNINPFASVWFWNLYVSYGFGLAIADGGIGFNIYDIRLGWQPKFNKKHRGLCFKMELGFASAVCTVKEPDTNAKKDADGNYPVITSLQNGGDFFLTLGASYKF